MYLCLYTYHWRNLIVRLDIVLSRLGKVANIFNVPARSVVIHVNGKRTIADAAAKETSGRKACRR